jgi:protein-S-isoprenylcysteine O-methyltransferase Ste14
MERKKTILLAALAGAMAGALATLPLVHLPAKIPAFQIDHSVVGHWEFVCACAGWVIFSLYWEIAARNAAPAASSESRASRAVHVSLTNIALLLEVAPIQGIGRAVPICPWIMGAGVAVEAAGLYLAIWSRRHLGRNWSGEITIKVDHQLIRSGPYRMLRHPIYTGLLAMYAGMALVIGTWLALLGFAIASFAYWRKIRMEEVKLSAAFADYQTYRQETWALLPGLY